MTGKTRAMAALTWSSLKPQWSPVVMTGKTRISEDQRYVVVGPQWSPVVMTGKTIRCASVLGAATARRNGARS